MAAIAVATSMASVSAQAGTQQRPGWHVKTEEHIDLWLHGFALLTSDTGHVPFFARGYKQEVTALKRQKNILTQLDANQKELSARFAARWRLLVHPVPNMDSCQSTDAVG